MNAKGEMIVSGTILLVACSLYFHVAAAFSQYKHHDLVGPALWPKIILFSVIILSGSLFIKNAFIFFKTQKLAQEVASPLEKKGAFMLRLTIILTLLYCLGLPYTGFLFSIICFQFFVLLILKVKKIQILIFYPLGLTLLIYMIFIKFLNITVPRGTGIFLTFSRLFY